MNLFLPRLAMVTAFAVVGILAAQSVPANDPAVRAPIDNYFNGHATGNGDYFRKAFHPDAKLFFIRDGKYSQLTSEEFAARATGKPAADEAQRKRWIEQLDVTGDAALAKVILDYPEVRFTDYLSLLKINGEWKIINKIFYAEKKQSK